MRPLACAARAWSHRGDQRPLGGAVARRGRPCWLCSSLRPAGSEPMTMTAEGGCDRVSGSRLPPCKGLSGSSVRPRSTPDGGSKVTVVPGSVVTACWQWVRATTAPAGLLVLTVMFAGGPHARWLRVVDRDSLPLCCWIARRRRRRCRSPWSSRSGRRSRKAGCRWESRHQAHCPRRSGPGKFTPRARSPRIVGDGDVCRGVDGGCLEFVDRDGE